MDTRPWSLLKVTPIWDKKKEKFSSFARVKPDDMPDVKSWTKTGSGTTSKVYKHPSLDLVVKVFKKSAKNAFAEEKQILNNLVLLFHSAASPQQFHHIMRHFTIPVGFTRTSIFYTYCGSPSLISYMKKHWSKRTLTWDRVMKILQQVLVVCTMMWNAGLTHGDLYAKNMCYDEETNTIVIIDYGLTDRVRGFVDRYPTNDFFSFTMAFLLDMWLEKASVFQNTWQEDVQSGQPGVFALMSLFAERKKAELMTKQFWTYVQGFGTKKADDLVKGLIDGNHKTRNFFEHTVKRPRFGTLLSNWSGMQFILLKDSPSLDHVHERMLGSCSFGQPAHQSRETKQGPKKKKKKKKMSSPSRMDDDDDDGNGGGGGEPPRKKMKLVRIDSGGDGGGGGGDGDGKDWMFVDESDDLTVVKGISKKRESFLNARGITALNELKTLFAKFPDDAPAYLQKSPFGPRVAEKISIEVAKL